MNSIRRTLITGIVPALFLLTFLFSIAGFLWARQSLIRQVDTVLAAKAKSLVNLVEMEGDGKIHIEFQNENMPEFSASSAREYFQIWKPNGEVLSQSKSLGNAQLPRLPGSISEPIAETIKLPHSQLGRAVGFKFDPVLEIDEKLFTPTSAVTDQLTIVVAKDTRDIRTIITTLAFVFLGFTLLLPLAALAIILAVVHHGLRPLSSLAKEVSQITPASLSSPVSAGENTHELRPIVFRLNELLARLDAAFKRERRFTMDASHELRTPLAESRTSLEVALKWPDDHQLLLNAARDSLESTRQMESLVATLLTLARANEKESQAPVEPVDLVTVIHRCWDQLGPEAVARPLQLYGTMKDTALVISNHHLVSAILLNLLKNAVRYSPAGRPVSVTLDASSSAAHPTPGREDVSDVSVAICNEMSTPLTESDLQLLFEPLWRKDHARGDAAEDSVKNFGLGLALVRSYCHALEIPIAAEISHKGFCMNLLFPCGPH